MSTEPGELQTQREAALRVEAEDKVLGRRTRYTYDGLDRLRQARTESNTATPTSPGVRCTNTITPAAPFTTTPIVATPVAGTACHEYELDRTGNVTRKITSGSALTANTSTYAYNAANQLCWRSTAGTTPPSNACQSGTGGAMQSVFDANGNETTSVTGRTAVYNKLDQTTRITPLGGSPTDLVYLGAGQDRWITEGTGTFQHNVLGVGKRTVGASTDYFTRDEGGKLVSRRNGTTRHYYLHDALGSVTGLINNSGALEQRYDYEPYGAKDPSTGTTLPNADVPTGQFGFAGGYRSVGGLYHYGQRYYDPATMRWTQPDPLDQTGDLREGTRYLYAGGDPVSLADPTGEALPAIGVGAAAAGGAVARWAAPRVAAQTIKLGSRYGSGPGLRNRIFHETVINPGKNVAQKVGEKVGKAASQYGDEAVAIADRLNPFG